MADVGFEQSRKAVVEQSRKAIVRVENNSYRKATESGAEGHQLPPPPSCLM